MTTVLCASLLLLQLQEEMTTTVADSVAEMQTHEGIYKALKSIQYTACDSINQSIV